MHDGEWLADLFLLVIAIALLGAGFYAGRATAPEAVVKPPPGWEQRIVDLEAKVECWQTIHPKRCQEEP